MSTTYNKFVPLKNKSLKLLSLQYIFCTFLNYAVCSPIFYAIARNEKIGNNDNLVAILFFIIIFIIPVLLGIIGAILYSKSIFRKIMNWVGINPIHEIPTGWDYKFYNTSPKYVVVTLMSEQCILGYFGTKSFASSDTSERDLYLEKVFYLDNEDNWVERKNSNGIWLRGDQIKHIEFF